MLENLYILEVERKYQVSVDPNFKNCDDFNRFRMFAETAKSKKMINYRLLNLNFGKIQP